MTGAAWWWPAAWVAIITVPAPVAYMLGRRHARPVITCDVRLLSTTGAQVSAPVQVRMRAESPSHWTNIDDIVVSPLGLFEGMQLQVSAMELRAVGAVIGRATYDPPITLPVGSGARFLSGSIVFQVNPAGQES